jgi:hypothetical protein
MCQIVLGRTKNKWLTMLGMELPLTQTILLEKVKIHDKKKEFIFYKQTSVEKQSSNADSIVIWMYFNLFILKAQTIQLALYQKITVTYLISSLALSPSLWVQGKYAWWAVLYLPSFSSDLENGLTWRTRAYTWWAIFLFTIVFVRTWRMV